MKNGAVDKVLGSARTLSPHHTRQGCVKAVRETT